MIDMSDVLRSVIRTEPVQERSEQRITRLLDAAAAILDETGPLGLTTTDVATRSQSSVGVVYRYFPNIQSLLRALAGRNIERYVARLAVAMPEDPARWRECGTVALDSFIAMMREEPGFRSIGIGHGIEGPVFDLEDRAHGLLAQLFSSMLATRYELPVDDELIFRLEVAVELSEGLVRRAFMIDPKGDARFLARARELVDAEIRMVGGVNRDR